MSDLADDYRAMKEYRQEKKDKFISGKMKEHIQLVVNNSELVEFKNFDTHLVVHWENGEVCDYWPTTQRWIARKAKGRGYNIESMLKYYKKEIK